MKKILLFILFISIFITGCKTVIYEKTSPPPPKMEIYGNPPSPGAVWIAGQWVWKGPKKGYVWVPGHWKRR